MNGELKKSTAGLIVCAGLLALFGLLTWEVFSAGGLAAFDQETSRAARSWRTPERDSVAHAVTLLGHRRFLGPATLLAVAVLVFAGRRVPAAFFAGSVLGGSLLEFLLKVGFHRARPPFALVNGAEKYYSFPSGHATMATLFFGGLAAVVFHLTRRRATRFAAILVAVVLIAAVSFTRVSLGLHWVTDVFAGILLGLFGVTLGATTSEWLVGRKGAASGPPARPPR